MAKYDQGGGCACGLYRECCCEDVQPKAPKPVARIKITDAMVGAAIMSLHQSAIDTGHPLPPEDEAPEQWAEMRDVMRKALTAARDAI